MPTEDRDMGRRKLSSNFEIYAKILIVFLFLLLGSFLTRNSVSASTLGWMRVYRLSDFENAGMAEIVKFYMNLRIPIPPVLSLGEILSSQYLGHNQLLTIYGYRLCMVAMFLMAIWRSRMPLWKFTFAVILATILMHGVSTLHPTNPQMYDIYFPTFLLLYFLIIAKAFSKVETRWGSALLFLAGFWLSMAELARPFFFMIMIFLIAGTLYRLHLAGKKAKFIYFVFPILLLSGSWHLHMALSFSQMTWSNHSGYNLKRAWRHVPVPADIEEINNAPLGPNRLPNLNTAEHFYNSNQRQKAILGSLLRSPIKRRLFGHSVLRMMSMLRPQTVISGRDPVKMPFYEISVNIVTGFLVINVFLVLTYLLMLPTDWRGQVASTRNWQILTAWTCLFVMAFGARGEDVRFLMAVLALFSAMPESAVVWKDYKGLVLKRYLWLASHGRRIYFGK